MEGRNGDLSGGEGKMVGDAALQYVEAVTEPLGICSGREAPNATVGGFFTTLRRPKPDRTAVKRTGGVRGG